MLQRGKTLFWVLATALVVLVLVTLRQLPPVVASHFDAAGVPNGWSSRSVYALLIMVIGALLPLGITGLVAALTRRGPEKLNIPARDHWLRPEHRDEAVRRVRAHMWWLGSIMAGIALTIHGLVLAAHSHDPPRLSTSMMVVVLSTVLITVGAWMVSWYRLLRRPAV